MMQKAILVCAFSGAFVLQGCGGGGNDECSTNSDCTVSGEVCLNKEKTDLCDGASDCVCGEPPQQSCTEDSECTAPETCLNKDMDGPCASGATDCVCGEAVMPGGECTQDSECTAPETCLNNDMDGPCESGETDCKCGEAVMPTECTSDTDCKLPETCRNSDNTAKCNRADDDCRCAIAPTPPPKETQCFGACSNRASTDSAFCSKTPKRNGKCEFGTMNQCGDIGTAYQCYSQSRNGACRRNDTDCYCYDPSTAKCDGAACEGGAEGACGAGEPRAPSPALTCVYKNNRDGNKKGMAVADGAQGVCAAGETKFDGEENAKPVRCANNQACRGVGSASDDGLRTDAATAAVKNAKCSSGQTGKPSSQNFVGTTTTQGYCVFR